MSTKGYVHVYTGNGKGKTTAALGLAIRAAGAGWKVFIAQFGKGAVSSELESLRRFSDLITIRHYGKPQLSRLSRRKETPSNMGWRNAKRHSFRVNTRW